MKPLQVSVVFCAASLSFLESSNDIWDFLKGRSPHPDFVNGRDSVHSRTARDSAGLEPE